MLQLFRRTTPRAADVAHVDVAHAGDVYRVALKRSASARRFTLRVRAATRDIVLTMPARSSLKSAREFAERNAAWMGARLRRIPEPVDFIPGASVPLRGIAHTICHVEDRRGTVWAETGGLFGTQLCVAGARDHVPRRVADHLRREARRDILAAVARHTATLGKPARSVTLRDTTSRWGSCTAAGRAEFFLAPDSGARLCARLSRRARSRPSRAYGSFAALLAGRQTACPADRPRRGLAQGAWRGSAPLRRQDALTWRGRDRSSDRSATAVCVQRASMRTAQLWTTGVLPAPCPHTTPSSRNRAISPASMWRRSARISSVCSPASGGARW